MMANKADGEAKTSFVRNLMGFRYSIMGLERKLNRQSGTEPAASFVHNVHGIKQKRSPQPGL